MTYPSGTVTPLGASMLLNNIDPNLWVTSADGERTFYLMGGLSPVAPGVPGQDGIIVQSIDMAAPFKHKDLQAAQQDGVTWTQTVYEPGVIALQGEVHAQTSVGLTAVWDAWQGTWNPRQQCTLEHITLDGGYWWAPVRLAKAWQGAVKNDRRYLYRQFTHECRIDDAFWRGVPAIDVYYPTPTVGIYENFSGEGSSGTLSSSKWTVTYSSGHSGAVSQASGVGAYWNDTGNSTQSAEVISKTSTSTPYQVVSLTLGSSLQGFNLGGSAYNDIWCRVDGSGNAIVCRIGWSGVYVYRVNSGVFTQMFYKPLQLAPGHGEVWTFFCGTQNGPRTYALRRNNSWVFGFAEYGAASVVPSSTCGVGFGLETQGGALAMAVPVPVATFSASDNASVSTYTGYVTLCNIGTEDGWPTYTLTGPGQFVIGDGPGGVGGSAIIGPLSAGQVAQVTTLPRLRSIVDVYDPTNNLYPLMSGRFTTPIPGVAVPGDASSVTIPVGISGGDATSSIVANLTPLRIAPA